MSLTAFLLYAIVGLCSYIYYKFKQRFTYWQTRGIACEEPHYLLGNFQGMQTKKSFAEITNGHYEKFKGTGPFSGFYWFQRQAVLILDIELAKQILIKDFNNFTDRGFFANEKDDPLTGHLFLLDGHKWRAMRNKLSPTFTSGKMKFMFPTIIKVANEFAEVFDATVKENAIVEVKDLLGRYATDVIGTTAFGIECSSLKDPNTLFRVMGKKALGEPRHGLLGGVIMEGFPALARKLRMKQFRQDVEDFFSRIVRETVEYREKNNVKRNDFMNMLIELKNNKLMKTETGEDFNLTLDQIMAQAFVFFTAGFETSSTTMGFALYELAQHADVQQKARDEIHAVLQKYEQQFTYEGMKEMQYLEQIISETLRLYTIVPTLNRVALEDYVVPNQTKYIIKKGMPVLIPAAAFHRDADFYANPNEFNPDNFTAEKVKARDSVEWLPFGDGPRNCIGMRFGQMQTRIGLAMLLKDFKFSVCDKTTIPMQYDKKNFLVSSESGIYLKVEKI